MVFLDYNSTKPLYQQLYEGLKSSILSGNIQYNSPLVPIRKSAQELFVSRNTIDHAYQMLLSEGYVRSVRGGGYFVDYVPENLGTKTDEKTQLSNGKRKLELKYDFKYESVESYNFPWTKWTKYIRNALLEEECSGEIGYECNKGYYPLRENLCSYLNKMRGVNCSPEQIVICAGTQFAIQTILSVLPKKKYRLAFENPGYDGMKKVFENGGVKLDSVNVLEDGIDLEMLKAKNCNMVYITPSHQFPSGYVTSLQKRLDLLEWAEENDAYIIENDYDNEFSYSERRLPSLQALDNNDRVIYVSTLTKVLSPSIRTAFFVLPKRLVKSYEEHFSFFNSSLPTYHQRALAQFIADGEVERHMRELVVVNKRKYVIIREYLYKQSDGLVKLFSQSAGSHTLIKIPRCTDQKKLIEYMRENSIGLYGTKSYWNNQNNAPEDTFLFGFSSMGEAELEKGCREFVRVLKKYFD